MDVKFLHLDFGDGVYAISAPATEQMYLVCGTQKAVLIDTGMGIGSLKDYVRKLTDLPLIVINTHGHPDHGGGNGEFEDVPIYMSDRDIEIYEHMCTTQFRIKDVKFMIGKEVNQIKNEFISGQPKTLDVVDGMTFDLGGRTLKTIAVPGHTPGCICLYDDLTRCLFAGDSLTIGDTWMYLDHSLPMMTYLKSMVRLLGMNLPISRIFPGHLPTPVAPDMILRKIACAKAIIANPLIGTPVTTFAGSGLRHEKEGGAIIYDPLKINEDNNQHRP